MLLNESKLDGGERGRRKKKMGLEERERKKVLIKKKWKCE